MSEDLDWLSAAKTSPVPDLNALPDMVPREASESPYGAGEDKVFRLTLAARLRAVASQSAAELEAVQAELQTCRGASLHPQRSASAPQVALQELSVRGVCGEEASTSLPGRQVCRAGSMQRLAQERAKFQSWPYSGSSCGSFCASSFDSVGPVGSGGEMRRTQSDFSPKASQKGCVCPSGHVLLGQPANDGWKCNVCEQIPSANTLVMCCEECQWFCCGECLAKTRGGSARGQLGTKMRLHPVWQGSHSSDREFWQEFHVSVVPRHSSGRPSMISASMNIAAHGDSGYALSCCRRLQPTSRVRIIWDCLGLLVFMIDVWVSPLYMVFGVEVEFLGSLIFACLIYWTASVPMCFAYVNYTRDGELEVNPMWHYIRTWFIFDCIIVGVDWFDLMALQGVDGISTLGYAVRAVRILRVLRVLRLNGMLSANTEAYEYSAAGLGLSICKYMIGLLFIVHIVACGWYAVGARLQVEEYGSWITEWAMLERAVLERYFGSLHWALGQFSPTKMRELPTNVVERIYAVLTGTLAFTLNPIFLGRVTTSMVSLQNIAAKRNLQTSRLQKYVRKHDVSSDTRRKIFTFLRRRRAAQHIAQGDVELLKDLPADMSAGLRMEIVRPLLHGHPFFKLHLIVHCDNTTVRTMATDVISDIVLDLGKRLFAVGEPASSMYFLREGELQYIVSSAARTQAHLSIGGSNTKKLPSGNTVCVVPSDWLAEHAMWYENWSHKGMATASWYSELFVVSATGMRQLLGDMPYARFYAHCFFESCPNEHGCWSDAIDVVQLAQEGPRDEVPADPGQDMNFMAMSTMNQPSMKL